MIGRSAVLAPGGNNSVDVPALMFARLAVQRRAGRAHPVRWKFAEGRDVASQRQRVLSQVEEAVDELTAATGAPPVVIGKSLGSLAAPLIADRGLAAVWFTPLLTDEQTVAALRRAMGPALLVGGTADPYWDGRIAGSIAAANVIEIDGADHAMVVPGRLAESAAALGQIISAVEDFLDQVVWPSPIKLSGPSHRIGDGLYARR
jgi:alpha-beta hydrolase superfamily lysophospholipase